MTIDRITAQTNAILVGDLDDAKNTLSILFETKTMDALQVLRQLNATKDDAEVEYRAQELVKYAIDMHYVVRENGGIVLPSNGF